MEVNFVNAYDFLERAWLNAQENVRDYEMYSKRIQEDEIKQVFKQYAEEEGKHAQTFRELLLKYKDQPFNDSATNLKETDSTMFQ